MNARFTPIILVALAVGIWNLKTKLKDPVPQQAQVEEVKAAVEPIPSPVVEAADSVEISRAPDQVIDNGTIEPPPELQKLQELKTCIETESCSFDESDPKAAHFAAAAAIQAELRSLSAKRRENASLDFSEVAREWLNFDEDYVRESALELIQLHEKNAENLSAILTGLESSISPVLLTSALPILLDYASGGYQERVNDFLATTISKGPLKVSEELSQKVLPFLTTETVSKYEELQNQLPDISSSRNNIEAAIREYERVRGGG